MQSNSLTLLVRLPGIDVFAVYCMVSFGGMTHCFISSRVKISVVSSQ